MKTATPSALTLAALALIAGHVSAKTAALDAAGAARLDAYRHAPDAAGELIYRGAVFDQHEPRASALFSYERRVGPHAKGQSAAHITHAPNGDVVIVEEADVRPGLRAATVRRHQPAAGLQRLGRAQQRRAPPRLSPATGWRGHERHRRRQRPGRQRTVLARLHPAALGRARAGRPPAGAHDRDGEDADLRLRHPPGRYESRPHVVLDHAERLARAPGTQALDGDLRLCDPQRRALRGARAADASASTAS